MPATANMIIDTITRLGPISHIPPGHPFHTVADKMELPSTEEASEDEKKQIRIAYLIYVMDELLQDVPSGAETTLSTLILAFPTGRLGRGGGRPYLRNYRDTIGSLIPRRYGLPARDVSSDLQVADYLESIDTDNKGLVEDYLAYQGQKTHEGTISTGALRDLLKAEWQNLTHRPFSYDKPPEAVTTSSSLDKETIEAPVQEEAAAAPAEDMSAGQGQTTMTIASKYATKFEYDLEGAPRPVTDADYLNDDDLPGKLIIGDIVFPTPPTGIRFTTMTQAMSLPTIRTTGSPVLPKAFSAPMAVVSILFDGIDDINNLLRPLYAMYRNAPLITLQNRTIAKEFLGRVKDKSTEENIADEVYFQHPLPVVLESINLHTVQGYPNVIQATLNIAYFNHIPYSPGGLEFLKTTVDARQQASYNAMVYSKAYRIESITRDKGSDQPGAVVVSNQAGELKNIEPPKIALSNVTEYPAESWPFHRYYRSDLKDFPAKYRYPGTRTPTMEKYYPQPDNPDSRDEVQLKLDYLSATRLSTPRGRFYSELNRFKSLHTNLAAVIDTITNDPTEFSQKARLDEPKGEWFRGITEIFNEMDNTKVIMDIIQTEFEVAVANLQDTGAGQMFDADIIFTETDAKGFEHVSRVWDYANKLIDKWREEESESAKLAGNLRIIQDFLEGIQTKVLYRYESDINKALKASIPAGLKNQTLAVVPPETVKRHTARDKESNREEDDEENAIVYLGAQVEGLSITYRNSLAQIPVIGYRTPTYQHIGGNNDSVTISLKTNDENVLKYLADARDSLSALALERPHQKGVYYMDLAKVQITDDLLQSLGMNRFAIAEISSSSIAGAPGWRDVQINLIHSEEKITDWETLKLVSQDSPMTNAVAEIFLPLSEIEIDYSDIPSSEWTVGSTSSPYFGGTPIQGPPNVDLYQITSDYVVRAVINTDEDYPTVDIKIETSTGKKHPKTDFYRQALKPVLDRGEYIIDRLTAFSESTTVTSLNQQYQGRLRIYLESLVISISKLLDETAVQNNTQLLDLESEDRQFNFYGYSLNVRRQAMLNQWFLFQDFQDFLNRLLEDTPPGDDKTGIPDEDEFQTLKGFKSQYQEFKKKRDKAMGSAYPDLPIPNEQIDEEGASHRLFGPGFYFYHDRDFSEYTDMYGALANLRASVSTQIAALQGQLTTQDYEQLKESIGEDFIQAVINGLGFKPDDLPSFLTERTYKTGSWNEEADGNWAINLFQHLGNYSEALEAFYAHEDWDLDWIDLMKGISPKREVAEDQADEDSAPLADMPKDVWAKAIVGSKLLQYVTLMSVLGKVLLSGNEEMRVTSVDIDENKKVIFKDGENPIKTIPITKLVNQIFNNSGDAKTDPSAWGAFTSAPSGEDSKDEYAERLHNIIAALKKELTLLLGQDSAEKVANVFGVTDTKADIMRLDLLDKITQEHQSNRQGSMERAYPTFKLFFIEDNEEIIQSFDDFYSYDAVHSIDVIASKNAATQTAVIKLSNVTNKLTGEDIAALYREGNDTRLTSLQIKPGIPILLRMGYGSDYRQLPIVFQGVVTEVQPGPIFEITAQSYGAALLHRIGVEMPLRFTDNDPIQSLGGAILGVLDDTPGLDPLGRNTFLTLDQAESKAMDLSTKKFIRTLTNPVVRSLTGWGIDLFGAPDWREPVENLLKDRKDINLVLNIGNTLYDNIYVNNLHVEEPGWLPWMGRWFKKGFKWNVDNQTTWDALNEICLYLGDYIVTTLPYNEGSAQHLTTPRMTLYIGPKHGEYKSGDSYVTFSGLNEYIDKMVENMDIQEISDNLNGPGSFTAAVALYDKQIRTLIEEIRPIVTKARSIMGGEQVLKEALGHVSAAGYRNITELVEDEHDITWWGGALKYLATSPIENIDDFEVLLFHLLFGHIPNDRARWDRFYSLTGYDLSQRQKERLETQFAYRQKRMLEEGYFDRFKTALIKDHETVLPKVLNTDISNTANKTANHIIDQIRKRGLAAGSPFEPIVQHHFVTGYTDIVSNDIIATSDRMYNAVEVWYPKDKGGEPVKSHKTFYSYDLDPQSLRLYTTFQKNLEENLWLDVANTEKAGKENDPRFLPMYMRIGTRILSNVMQPMYQGTFTMLGNPNIRPYHVLHIYDDVNNISGPVEVEEVIHSFSTQTGFTTTIVPNVLIYDRNRSDYHDQLYLHTLGKLRSQRMNSKILTGLGWGALKVGGVRGLLGLLGKWAPSIPEEATQQAAGAGEFRGRAAAAARKTRGRVTGPAAKAAATGAKKAAGKITAGRLLQLPLKFIGPITLILATYEGVMLAHTLWEHWAQQVIGEASVMFGHNPLLCVYLIHNGRPYVAGIEGVDSMDRSLYAVTTGQIRDARGEVGAEASVMVNHLLARTSEE